MAISPSRSRSGLISRERETRPETCIGLGHRPKFWGRYVDDTGVVNRQEHEQELFDHINTQHDSIKFTIEREQDNRLPMLDVMMVRNPDNTITTDVFRKETHTDHYLQWSSNHPVQQKLGIVRTLMHRANTLIEDPALREAEKEKVRVDLRHCGYPEWALREGGNGSRKDKCRKEQSKTGKQEQLPASYLVLPYIYGVTERLKRVYAEHNVSLYSKPGFTLRNALVRPNDPLAPGEKYGVIYKIKCEECGEVYVDQESRNPHRKIKEAVHIQLEGAKLNRTEVKESIEGDPQAPSGAEERLLALERDIAGVEAGTEYVLDEEDVPLSKLPGKKNKNKRKST
ncbi:hypothetical protein Bbelb_155670 [Branchiostoma belcheri]|nr:hypothetical protein Bbelb_155670 [Branchiostoma belcheri]